MTTDLQGKTAVVTGGSQGAVGRAVVLALSERGFDVAIIDQQARQAAEETSARIRSLGVKAICLQGAGKNSASALAT
jgi:NAD(P)-dependent dehydrogenase (short-subunit alcohol dehydrogenase family)